MTAVSGIKYVDDAPQLGGETDEDNWLIVIKALEQSENRSAKVLDQVVVYLSTHKLERVERAAASLIGVRFEFKDGPVFFTKEAVLNLYHRCQVFKYLFDKQKLEFPHLSKDSFRLLLDYYEKKVDWPFITMLEVYMTFGSSSNHDMHHDLKEVLSYYNPISATDLALCYDQLKKDPVIRLWIHLRSRRNDEYYNTFVRTVSHYDEPIVVTRRSIREDSDASVHLKDIHSGILVNTRKKRRVILDRDFCFTQREAEMFRDNNPELRELTLRNVFANIPYFFGGSVKRLTLQNCEIGDEWHLIVNLEHLTLSNTKIPQNVLEKLLYKITSFTYDNPRELRLSKVYPQLEKVVLTNSHEYFYTVPQRGVKYLGIHGHIKLDHMLCFLHNFPNITTLDLSVGHEVVNHIDVDFFDNLAKAKQSIKTLILRERIWPRLIKIEDIWPSLEVIDVSLSDFFEDGRVRVSKLKRICPNLRSICFSHHETLNFRHVIEALQEEFKEILFEEIEVYPKELVI